MPKLLRLLALAIPALAATGCGLVYKPTVQQGNLLEKKDLNQLKPGMTKRQVAVLLGTPAVTSPFDHDRWDYVNTVAVNGHRKSYHAITLYFEYGTLARTEGQYYGQSAKNEQQLLEQAKKFHVEISGKGARGDKNHGGDSPSPDGD